MLRKMKTMAAAAAIAGVVALAGAGNASALNVGTIGSPVGSGTMPSSASAGASRVVLNGTVPVNCTTTTTTSIIGTGVYGVPATIGNTQFQFTTCTGPSGFVFSLVCSNVTSYEFASNPVGGVAIGRYSNINCRLTFAPIGCTATLSGTVPVTYANPTTVAPGVATFQAAGQSLAISASTCPTGIVPNGPAVWGSPVGTGLGVGNLPFTLAGAPTSQPFLS